MNWFDELFQLVMGVTSLAIMFRLCYRETAMLSVVYAVSTIIFFSLGRFGVKLYRWRKQRQRRSSAAADEIE